MRGALAAVFVLAAVAAAPSAAAPKRELLIVPGQQIGKVRIGMSLAQVRRALGRPTGVNKRTRTAFGGTYVEYDWGYGRWTVGLSGRARSLRVSLVATTVRRERTREGVGVGSLLSRVKAVYRRAGLRCPPPRDFDFTDPACRLVSRSRAVTYFPTQSMCTDTRYSWNDCPTGRHAPGVYEVMVRTPAAVAPTYD